MIWFLEIYEWSHLDFSWTWSKKTDSMPLFVVHSVCPFKGASVYTSLLEGNSLKALLFHTCVLVARLQLKQTTNIRNVTCRVLRRRSWQNPPHSEESPSIGAVAGMFYNACGKDNKCIATSCWSMACDCFASLFCEAWYWAIVSSRYDQQCRLRWEVSRAEQLVVQVACVFLTLADVSWGVRWKSWI